MYSLQTTIKMMTTSKNLKICDNGHQFYKSSDCPTCPICEKSKKPLAGFLALLSNPARNALLHHGIITLEELSTFTEKEILNLHGVGKASLPIFRSALAAHGLCFMPTGQSKNKE